jgi:hypothetical protein
MIILTEIYEYIEPYKFIDDILYEPDWIIYS